MIRGHGSVGGVTYMTQPRPETRVTANLKLRVWGMGADGRAFSQNAHTCNISSGGALLSGIEPDLKVGETIGLQYGEKKARCTVVWAINRGALQKAGVKLLNEQECPWTAELRSIDNDTLVSPQNRRRWNRHKISFLIENT